jgi:MFS family permease
MKRFSSRAGKLAGWMMTAVGSAIAVGVLGGAVLLGWFLAAIVNFSPILSIAVILLVFLPILAIFGLVPIALGSVFLRASEKAKQEAIRDRFFRVLQINQGRISLVEFSRAAELEPVQARQMLDRWARECDATFDVTEDGDIYYVFYSQPFSLPGGDRPFEAWQQWVQHRITVR